MAEVEKWERVDQKWELGSITRAHEKGGREGVNETTSEVGRPD